MSGDEDRHALITGGGTGIGRAIAQRLSDEGWKVTVVGRRTPPLREVARQSESISFEVADVTDEAAVGRAFERAEGRFGFVSAVIANAGSAESAPLHRVELSSFRRAVDVNLIGSFLVARAGLFSMLERRTGAIVFVASTAGLRGYPYVASYCAAKHGVVGLMRALALETAKLGITVNAICPGYTETGMLDVTLENIAKKTGRTLEEARAALLSTNPQGRFIDPEEIAAAASWLLSEGAASVTGQALSISGGEV